MLPGRRQWPCALPTRAPPIGIRRPLRGRAASVKHDRSRRRRVARDVRRTDVLNREADGAILLRQIWPTKAAAGKTGRVAVKSCTCPLPASTRVGCGWRTRGAGCAPRKSSCDQLCPRRRFFADRFDAASTAGGSAHRSQDFLGLTAQRSARCCRRAVSRIAVSIPSRGDVVRITAPRAARGLQVDDMNR